MKKLGRIAAVAVSGKINPKKFQLGLEFLNQFAESVNYSEQIYSKFRNMAGTDDERLDSLLKSLQNNSIDLIWAIRGGHGALRLLDKLPHDLKINDKMIIGYSDITAYQWFFYKVYRLKSIAGPMIQVDFSKNYSSENLNFLFNLISKKKSIFALNSSIKKHNYKRIEGPIIGGCLSVICRLCGTDYFPNLENHILFLEDVNEELYKIDGMLAQLKLTGVLNQISGLILGQFTSIDENDNNPDDLYNLFKEYFWDLDIPVIYNFPHGHIDNMVPLPIGYSIHFKQNELEFHK